MGIKSLNNIIKNYANSSIRDITLNELWGKKIAVDTSIYLYRFKHFNNDILSGFTRQILKLLKNGITPFYIFDGKPPEEKKEVLDTRKNRKAYLHYKCEILENIMLKKDNMENYLENIELSKEKLTEYFNSFKDINNEECLKELNKVKKQIITITKNDNILLKQYFDLLNIPYYECNGEAETFCAILSKEKIVNGCLTEDTDFLASGGQNLYKNFNINRNFLTNVNLDNILEQLELSYKEFLDLCILCGCDYTTKINGIGPITSLKMIKKYNNIEAIIEEIKTKKKYKIPENFDYKNARKLFLEPNFSYDINFLKSKLKMNNVDSVEIINFLENNSLKLSKGIKKEINNNLNNYINNLNNPNKKNNKKKKKQNIVQKNTLTNYFKKKDMPITEEISLT